MSKDIEDIRTELIDLIEQAGNDYKAAELLNNLLEGFGPDRSTLLRMRQGQGQGKPTMIAMTTKLLKICLAK